MRLSNTELQSVDIGAWRSYQSYTNKEQIALQRNNFVFTGLEVETGELVFIYTTQIESLLAQIENYSSEVRIEDTETVIENEVYYTCKIEGAKITRVRTKQLHNGAPVCKNDEYSERMVKNSFEAVKLLNLIGSRQLSTDILVKVWNVLVEGACDNLEFRGPVYRIGDIEVGTHKGTDFKQVPKLMNNWISFYNSPVYDDKPFLKAVLLHYAFEVIHPFCDGNGRMGRLLMNNYLISRNVETARAVSFSMQIDARRIHYDAAFVDAENLYNDCTPFLEYMLEVMYSAYETALIVQKEGNEPDNR